MKTSMRERRSLAQGWSYYGDRNPWQWPCREGGRPMRAKKDSQGHPGHRWDQLPQAPYILGPSRPSNKGFLYLGLGEAEREEQGYRHFLPERTTIPLELTTPEATVTVSPTLEPADVTTCK
ncbi:hypothetical protein QYF61_009448 [Mycteria americana]|uniref:Uncharacterized protein n=1 Tax=Mycteria americana TaxID=33587 RepID=A0AAN7RXR3_MYCAM|nr:hypothetical protein QYF61_009448 [Mycteria americana]